jgi:hypothetical protein
VIATTMAGTSVSSVSMLEKNRVRHTSQYGSPLKLATSAASPKDDTKGATSTAPTMNAAIRRSVSNRPGASLRLRTVRAAMSASLQLVTNRAMASVEGRAAGCPSRCAGNAASR